MSAADPAHNGPPRPVATVLHLFKDRAPVRLGKRRNREAPVNTSSGDDPSNPHQTLADSAEQAFLSHDRTLTDPDTAEAYRITLGILGSVVVDGALANGLVDEDAHRDLQAIIEGLKAAPRLL